MDSAALLEMRGIGKAFGPVQALAGVDFSVRPGEVHALIGENGAGKSTLIKILSGAWRPDGGSIAWDGQPCRFRSPTAARRRGIAMIYQELTIAPDLTVAANVMLGAEQHRWGVVREPRTIIRETLTWLGHEDLDLDQPAGRASVSEQQVIEIARALMLDARLIIMDEPTSSLSAADTRALFALIRRLRERGVAVIYISHFLEEVMQVADRYTVLRDGRRVAGGDVAATTMTALVQAMVGRPLDEMFPRVPHEPGEALLEVEDLQAPGVEGVSFTVRRGEIVGIAGLVGAGRTELLRALYGLNRACGGKVLLAGVPWPVTRAHPGRALARGVDLLSENRKDEGLAVRLPVRDNMTLASLGRFAMPVVGWIHRRPEAAAVYRQVERLAIRLRDILQPVAGLSGGNQQKVAFARLLLDDGELLLLDEPTRGVDVGSKVEIYGLIGRLAAAGKGIVMVSSYLPELLGVCDRLAVMHRGRLSSVRPVAEWTREAIMAYATTGRREVA